VMPEHVHLLVNEPPGATLADALHLLKLSFAKRVQSRQRQSRVLSGRSDIMIGTFVTLRNSRSS
ncbi:MAG TPA: transposase, partial [Terriglobales bacterium]|nr:transposase [Terriglobales bacterium]